MLREQASEEKPTFRVDFSEAVTYARRERCFAATEHGRLRHMRLGFLPNAVEFRDPGLDSRDATMPHFQCRQARP
jgi:hypothetical protein